LKEKEKKIKKTKRKGKKKKQRKKTGSTEWKCADHWPRTEMSAQPHNMTLFFEFQLSFLSEKEGNKSKKNKEKKNSFSLLSSLREC
jgi:predicted acyl esterase